LKRRNHFYFSDFCELLDLVHSVTPSPFGAPPDRIDSDGASGIEKCFYSKSEDEFAAQELEVIREDDRDASKVISVRMKNSGKTRNNAENGWRWLWKMYNKREQWARAFVMSHFTAQTFTTQRSESWHSALKAYMANTYTLKALCQQLVDKATAMKSEKATKDIRQRNRVTEVVPDPLMRSARDLGVTGLAYKRLTELSNAARGIQIDKEVDQVCWVSDFESGEKAAVSLSQCTCQVPVNLGLPCKHMLKLFVVKQIDEIPTNLVHPLWLIGDDRVAQAEEALRRAEVGEKRGRKRTTLIDAGLLSKVDREYRISVLLNKMKRLAVNNAVAFEPVLAIFDKACNEAENQIRHMQPTARKRLAEETQKSSQPQLIDGDTSDEAEVAEEGTLPPVKVKNPEPLTSGSGRTRKARYKSRGQ